MRSHYDDFAVGETNKLKQNNNLINNNHQHHNYINNISGSGGIGSSSSSYNNNNNNNNNGAIPYHARENSLPFSYGQITKTSTPLRPTTTNTSSSSLSTLSASTLARNYNKNAHELDFDFDFDFDLNSAGRKNLTGGISGISGSGSGAYDYDVYGKSALNGTYASTIDRVKQNNISKRHNYHQQLYDHNDNDHDLNASEKYLNDIVLCTQKTVKYNHHQNNNNNNTSVNSGNNIYSNLNNNGNNNNNNNSETDASMIKAQPRLTSPLLVRKTLGNGCSAATTTTTSNSRSPTRYASNSNSNSNSNTNTNTIANTYHYSYGNGNSNKNANFIGDNNFDKFGLNGDINDINYGHKTMYGGGGGGVGGVGGIGGIGDTLTKTPARHDFDELLRERREKVLSEYRSTTHDLTHATSNSTSTLTPKASPVPPPRRFANGVVQLPSTLPPMVGQQKSSSSLYPPQTPNRSQSQKSRYNYDIEFNLNLNERYGTAYKQAEDEVDNVSIMRRRTNTIDSSPQRRPQLQPQQQKQQQQLYQTRDIPLASSSSSYVERNYHTISSSSALTHAKNSNNNNNNNSHNRETLSPTSMLDIYATPYDERINKRTTNTTMQPLEATSPASPITATGTTTLQRLQRSTEFATYGSNNNGNMFGHDHTNLGQTMTDRESSPIYATTTKKVTATTANYNNNNNNNLYRNTAATLPQASMISKSTTTLTSQLADYPSPNSQQRPETPAFPVTPRTPFNANSTSRITTAIATTANGSYLPQQPSNLNGTPNVEHYTTETIYGSNYRPRLNSSLSLANSEPQEVAAHLVKFAKDSSKFWYKPNLSREEAIALLINANPGTFVVRDSTTYKNAYGLVLRVAQPPPGSTSTGKPDELVRHFLIEPTTRGVRLKGCANEPVFTSLSALVYEHSINQLALPCLLNIPERDLVPPLVEPTPAQKQLMTQGAACNVLWLFSCDTESLTGEEAIRKAIRQMYALPSPPVPTEVHFKVTQQGITLTDNTRKKFFRKHYTADIISYCAIDPDHRLWTMQEHANDNTTVVGSLKKTIFAFVARRSPSSKDNQCHIFCDLAINQPASAIVSFVNKTLPTEKQKNYVL